jgi:hypothetical protein
MAQSGGAESGALGSETAPDLAEVVKTWPKLPKEARTEILAVVRAKRN